MIKKEEATIGLLVTADPTTAFYKSLKNSGCMLEEIRIGEVTGVCPCNQSECNYVAIWWPIISKTEYIHVSNLNRLHPQT